ncbi:DUF4124 domain-containing protein [Teredinibacter turnerae]|uniref:DUF4124 domain-containing protein n=1 Tax=Teredinibacter turnerae TaxID=2426 RepID=UPI00036EB3F8|nr:hypothetical protein [Teredinibacter turnerae]
MLLKKLLLILLLITSPIFAKDVYMWKDDGVYKYGDEKPDKQHTIVSEENAQKIINSLKNANSGSAPTRETGAIRSTMANYADSFMVYLDKNQIKKTVGTLKLTFDIAPNGSVSFCSESHSAGDSYGFNGKACEILHRVSFQELNTDKFQKVVYLIDIK